MKQDNKANFDFQIHRQFWPLKDTTSNCSHQVPLEAYSPRALAWSRQKQSQFSNIKKLSSSNGRSIWIKLSRDTSWSYGILDFKLKVLYTVFWGLHQYDYVPSFRYLQLVRIRICDPKPNFMCGALFRNWFSSLLASGNSKFQKAIVYPLNSVDLLDIETKRLYGTCGRFHIFFSPNLLHAVAFNLFQHNVFRGLLLQFSWYT